MRKMTYVQRADFGEALAMAMEPEAWARVHGGGHDADPEDAAKVIRAIRHSVAVMMLLDREGMI